MTQAQATAYFNSIPPAEQQAVRASGANILDWANASEAAGDPRALAFSGTRLQGGGDTYTGNVASGGAPSSDWLGKRKPTPAELRAYSVGKSEDFARFSDAQLADWIARKWDVAGGHFTNDAGDIVDKPTDSGPLSLAKGWATGEESAGMAYRGGAPAAAAPATPAASANPLADSLYSMFQNRQGFFADNPNTTEDDKLTGKLLAGGGLYWGGQGFTLPNLTPVQPAAAPIPATPQPAPQPHSTAWQEIPAGGLPLPSTNPVPSNGALPALPAGTPTTSPLASALMDIYRQPGQGRWWMQQ